MFQYGSYNGNEVVRDFFKLALEKWAVEKSDKPQKSIGLFWLESNDRKSDQNFSKKEALGHHRFDKRNPSRIHHKWPWPPKNIFGRIPAAWEPEQKYEKIY